MSRRMTDPAAFYERVYRNAGYSTCTGSAGHHAAGPLQAFVAALGQREARYLEVGSGRGAFQDLVEDYTGLDISASVGHCYHKPFVVASAESLPFGDACFDVVWSITVLEHIPDPDKALSEMRRVLKPGGLLFLHPAWHCRPWNCEGIPVRPCRDLSLRQKWIKLTLPVRDSLAVRALRALPLRLWRMITMPFRARPLTLKFERLKADYETFWMVDSDACCALDPLDVIQWFRSRGDRVLSHATWLGAFLSRSEAVIVKRGRG